jgi:hypothetical protein
MREVIEYCPGVDQQGFHLAQPVFAVQLGQPDIERRAALRESLVGQRIMHGHDQTRGDGDGSNAKEPAHLEGYLAC